MGDCPARGPAGPSTHYEVLGVHVSASRETIRQAYREQARRHHPDARNTPDRGAGPDGGSMAAVNAAWEVLGDPLRRRAYDVEIGEVSRPDSGWKSLDDDDTDDTDRLGGIGIEDLDDWSDRPARPPRPSDLLVMLPVLVTLCAVGLFFFSAMAGSTKLRALSLCFVPIAFLGFVAAPLLTMLRSRAKDDGWRRQ